MSQINDISSLLSSLDQINAHNQKSIFIPTLNREVAFKLLTASQHKSILTTIMEQRNSGVSLALLLNQIIKDNSTENIKFNTLDKNYILIALRAFSLSPIYVNENIKTDLLEVLKNKAAIETKSTIIKEDLYSIKLTPPTLDLDSSINRITKQKIESLVSEQTNNANKQILDEVYTNEFMKYIDLVEYGKETPITINFQELTINQKRQIIDKLPASTSTKMLTEINNYKDLADKFLYINDNKVNINFDQTFFTV